MTELLEHAVDKVKALPDKEQDAIAAVILEELEGEARWDQTFARTQTALEKLAAAAMAEDSAGKTKALDPNRL
ncbi:MAG TPA: hypothetical protein VI457_01245 [Methylococcaceae bacterium]|nr:hypothetical protein [Methylococcaceae bacterium]